MTNEPLVVTYSDIVNFLKCRRLWYWNYVQDYNKPESVLGALAIGTRVHAALECYYKDLGDPLDEFDALTNTAEQHLRDIEAPPWDFEALKKETVIGRNCVEAHQDWLEEEGEDYNYDVFAVEQVLSTPMLDGRILLKGKADVIFKERDTGFLIVNDLKTTSAITSALREEFERSWQHYIYLICAAITYPDQIIHRSSYTVMKKFVTPPRTNSPVVVRWRVPGTSMSIPHRKVQLEHILRDMLVAYETGSNYPSPQMGCSWCSYRHPCEVIDERPGTEIHILAREFVKGSKHARYNTSNP